MQTIGNVDHMCFACSPNNPIGLKLEFKLEGDKVYTTFRPRKEHQGYNGCMHGGLISTLLDETMAQWLWLRGITCMTAEMTTRFSLAVPIGRELRVESRCISERKGRFFEMEAKLILADGTVAAYSRAKFLRVKVESLDKYSKERGTVCEQRTGV